MENNYKPNSRLSREKEKEEEVKEKKVEKIVKGTVKTKKKNSFLRMFLADEIVDIKRYIVDDVLIPTVKDALSDIIRNGVDMILFGEDAPSRKSYGRSSKISYTSYYDRKSGRDRDRDRREERRPGGYNYDDVILDSKGEATEVLDRLDELIEVYGMASVADLYDLVGISGNYTDNKYGWTDLRSATSQRVRDGYILKLPRAIPLN